MQTGRSTKDGNDRAVSEAIGFILIFGIIIAGIGLVALWGYPMLLQQQSSSDEQIMEKNLIVLQNDVKSLAYKTVPYKETSLKVSGGTLTVYNTTTPTSSYFSIYGSGNDIKKDDGTYATASSPLIFSLGDIRYVSTSAQTGMSLENGAVVKRMLAQTGSTMLAEPRWFYDSQTNTAVIYLIGFNTTDVMALSGVGTVNMQLDQTKTNSNPYPIPAGDTIYVKYTPNANADYSTAWGNYFKNTLGLSGPNATQWYSFPTTTQQLVINRYEIKINIV
ncbi:MAG: hypothetical protein ABR999_05995 [Methanoregula sp.]|jgi:hypothetical protein|uniref:DUF7289 family protein n=1 Tax=Methanoregula sp. TaxID=2052170 RepID=UPI003D109674